MSKMIDLTKMIQYNKNDPKIMQVKVNTITRTMGKKQINLMGLPSRLFPEGFEGWTADMLKIPTHATTHMDAPYHYCDICEGNKAKTADEIPLELCYGDGVVIDMSHKPDNSPVTVDDIKQALEKTGSRVGPGIIVLIRTDRDKFMGTKEYPKVGPGVSSDATEWLIDQGVRMMGTDQWSWDLPLSEQIRRSKETNNKELFWEAHLLGRKREHFHIEQMTNLAALPPHGFKLSLFPMKIRGASGAPIRAVAILDN